VLPELLRNALVLGDRALATRLVDGVPPVTPLAQNVLAVCRPKLAEAAGDRARPPASTPRPQHAGRSLGNVPERAHALLGQGRCLAALGKRDSPKPLREARELFALMGYKPALAETDTLLSESEAAAV
jgi:hypothetical protein